MSLLNREVFWPPADELIEVAERIRARLGEWPAAETRWRICLTAPESPQAGRSDRRHEPSRTTRTSSGSLGAARPCSTRVTAA